MTRYGELCGFTTGQLVGVYRKGREILRGTICDLQDLNEYSPSEHTYIRMRLRTDKGPRVFTRSRDYESWSPKANTLKKYGGLKIKVIESDEMEGEALF